MCPVHPSVLPTLTSWAPLCRVQSELAALSEPIWPPRWRNLAFQAALQAQLGASWAQLGPPSRTPSATWRFLGRFLVLLQPSESSSRLHESSILMFLRSCLSRLPFELNLQALGLNLELTGALLGRTWPYLGASWTQLGASWALLGLNLAPLGPHQSVSWTQLGPPSRTPSATWRLLGPNRPSKPHSQSNLAPLGSIFGALATLRIELSPARELNSHVFPLLPFKTAL